MGLIFPIYLYRKLKNLRQKPMDRFQYNLAGMFLWWPSTKVVQAVMIVKKHGLFFSICLYKNFKNLLVRNRWTKLSFGDSVPRLFKPFRFVKKHGRQGVGLFFPIYLYRKLEKSSCQKPLDQFHYNLAKMFPWWPCTKIVQVIVILQKTWPLGGGAYFRYISV